MYVQTCQYLVFPKISISARSLPGRAAKEVLIMLLKFPFSVHPAVYNEKPISAAAAAKRLSCCFLSLVRPLYTAAQVFRFSLKGILNLGPM